ncbi:MAG: hypothetical protein CVV64_00070 [Candidatus Wallbacteria bacterium HGW-Wallbacteria-1]|jgi:protein-S-isoprenylcysteine O-methyltransferase Ste14|uniref:Isoprenylcysteine carboxyl methyltransferase n=1 Tax=Candidatus Wallbacteria bacterium HGW-Wallbacteria-1 TaxID=2013854 RepID=A0A2N1PU46_9BACT|nr:MAG: hypothetical protein CVV64_00070 [Candidatus Wallbacteria bacterium HGW-Wallbacteria-1]
MKEILERYRFTIINLSLFLFLAPYVFRESLKAWNNWQTLGHVDWVDLAFFLHNMLLLSIIIIRKDHVAVSRSYLDHFTAIFAFFSGLLFLEQVTENSNLLLISRTIIIIALLTGMASLLNLGRSFGILVALREFRTTGLYSVVRHPMYLTDILWKTGMIFKKPCPVNYMIFILTVSCYLFRASREEVFLSQWKEYREYREKVKYRFIPWIY